MEKNITIVLIVAALIIGGLVGYLIHSSSPSIEVPFGAANPSSTVLSYYAALNKQVLWDAHNTLLMDITAVRSPLAGLITATGTGSFGLVTGTGSTTNITATGAVSGDLCMVSIATSSGSFLSYCYVSGTGTTTVVVAPVSSSTINLSSPTVTVRVFPAASFIAPSALKTSTTTSY